MDEWCPSAGDIVVAYSADKVHIQDQGWTISGGGGAATKAAYNLIGGFAEFDIDFSNVKLGVNANIYTISPSFGGAFNKDANYCDGSPGLIQQGKWCMEVDWTESNGNCLGATTLHTKNQETGNDGCTAWGCRTVYNFNGKASFRMRVEFGTDGRWTTYRDGQEIGALSNSPGADAWNVLKSTYESKGGVVYSSMWTGWVADSPQCSGANAPESAVDASSFSVRNLKIKGSIVQGPTPRKCSQVQNLTSILV